ncbi:hypothetical protein [Henriciella sp.]|uniref:hypothetical protein n=1 Tax=Henriciella sp. TaxID=1968823 RepID=UPI00260BE816|nr:hypothetical protein [Henriciella sp.]
MLRSICLLLLALNLWGITRTAAAQKKPASFCQRIADAAYKENSRLDTRRVAERNSAPFVKKFLVSSAFENIPDAEGYRRIGQERDCRDEDTGEYSRCGVPGDPVSFDKAETYYTDPGLYEDFDRWSRTAGLLPVEGGLAAVRAYADYSPYRRGWTTGVFMTSIVDRESMMCAFENRIHEEFASPWCRSISENESNLIEVDRPMPEESREALYNYSNSSRPNDHYLKGHADLDIDGDGKAERLVKVNFSSGTGLCPNTYFDVLAPGSFTEFADDKIRELVREAQADQFEGPFASGYSCYRQTYLRVSDGKIWFERTGVGKVPADGKPRVVKGTGPLQRTLRTIEDGEVRNVCASRFSIEPIVAYDRERVE